jgi:hypothetical protein
VSLPEILLRFPLYGFCRTALGAEAGHNRPFRRAQHEDLRVGAVQVVAGREWHLSPCPARGQHPPRGQEALCRSSPPRTPRRSPQHLRGRHLSPLRAPRRGCAR